MTIVGQGRRADFPRLETVKTYRRNDTEGIWCINCIFVARSFRGKGMSKMLLAAAITAMKKRGVEVIEAYPVTTTRGGKKLAPTFSWTGPFKIFDEKGFKVIQRLVSEKPLVRLKLKYGPAKQKVVCPDESVRQPDKYSGGDEGRQSLFFYSVTSVV